MKGAEPLRFQLWIMQLEGTVSQKIPNFPGGASMPPDLPRWLLALAFETQLTPISIVVEHSPPLLIDMSTHRISGSVPILHT